MLGVHGTDLDAELEALELLIEAEVIGPLVLQARTALLADQTGEIRFEGRLAFLDTQVDHPMPRAMQSLGEAAHGGEGAHDLLNVVDHHLQLLPDLQ